MVNMAWTHHSHRLDVKAGIQIFVELMGPLPFKFEL